MPHPRSSGRHLAGSHLFAAACLAGLLAAPTSLAQIEEGAVHGATINDHLGWSASLDGDTAAVGAPGSHTNSQGRVRIYRRSGGLWSERQVLVGSTATPLDWFGHAVALHGNALVVGDWGESDGPQGAPGFRRGVAYVFRRADGNSPFFEEARLQPADLAEHDRFGMAVSVSGDVLAVSARDADDFGEDSGAVYVFRREGGAWTQEARLTAPAGAARDRFGFALAIDGDTLAVGADGADAAALDAGAVFVFTREGTAWTLRATLTSPAAAHDDRFGSALALKGELLAVGVPRRDVGDAPNAGVVEVWRGSGARWVPDGTLVAPSPRGFDNLGTALSLDGDRVLVGVPHADPAGPQSGLALLFGHQDRGWVLMSSWLGSAVDATARFGQAVALSGGLAVVGAPAAREPTTLNLGLVTFYGNVPGVTP